MKLYTILFFIITTSYAIAQNNLWIDTVSAGTKQIVQFNIKVSNTDSFTAVQLDVQLPSSLSYVDSSAVLDNARKADQVLSAGIVNSNTLRLLAYSGSLTAFNGNSGTVISFKCRTGTQAGNYNLTISNPLLGNAAGKNILTNYFNGSFTLLAASIQLDKSSLDFGKIPLGQYSDINVTITNTGTSQLNITGLTTQNSEIRFVDSSAANISPGNNIMKAIRFEPVTKGSKNILLEIKNNDPSDSVYIISAAGIGYTINEIHVGDINARSGYEAALSVSINNMEAFTAFEFTLQLPAVMKYEFGSGILSGRKADQVLSIDTLSNNQLKVIAYSPANTNFSGTSGEILQLKFQIAGSAGSYPLQISNPIISTNKGENIISASYNGTLNIISPRIYTANNNINLGRVSVKDTSTYILNVSNAGNDTLVINGFKIDNNKFRTGELFPQILAPNNSINVGINYHSSVEGIDSAVLQLYSNDAVTNPLVIKLSAESYSPNILYVKSESLFENEKGTISVSLSNLKKAAGVQLDITIPKVFTVNKDSIYLSNRKADHVIISAAVNDTTYRIISYSPTLKSFADTSGTLINIPVKSGNVLSDNQVTLSNAVLSDSAGKNILTDTNDGIITIVSMFPIELVSFRTETINSTIMLMWETISELNNYGFEIERSSNKMTWIKLGFVAGKGNSNSPKKYSFIDNDVISDEHYYYRLKQIDNDGNYVYSDVVDAIIKLRFEFNLGQNYPNPFNPATLINYSVPQKSLVTIKVYDIIGREVASLVNEEKAAGNYTVQFNASNLASGVYFYRMKASVSIGGAAFAETKKLLLLK